MRGVSELVECDVSSVRAAIAGRYLGVGDGARFAADRRSKPGVLLRLVLRQSARLGSVGNPADVIEPSCPLVWASVQECSLSGAAHAYAGVVSWPK